MRATFWAALLFHVVGVVAVTFTEKFPSPLDELAHYSYSAYVADTPALFPDFTAMRLQELDTGEWTSTANYLGHPSPYYHLMGTTVLLDPSVGPPSWPPAAWAMRWCNVVLSVAAMALILSAGLSLLLHAKQQIVFAASVVLFPPLAVMGGIVSNDNFALLGAAMVFAGFARRLQWGVSAELLIAIGLVVAGWAKLTAFLMLAGVVVFVEVFQLVSRERAMLSWRQLLLLSAMLIGAIPYLVNLLVFGSPTYLAEQYFVELAGARGITPLGFAQYTFTFLRGFLVTWSALEPANAVQILGFCLVLVLIVVGICLPLRATAERQNEVAMLCLCSGLAFLLVLPLHFYAGWSIHEKTGHLISSYARYYYPLWPGLALAVARSVSIVPSLSLADRFPLLRSDLIWIGALSLLLFSTMQFAIFVRWFSAV